MLIIAHRGASATAPEGTRAAVEGAVRASADRIELDVRLTRDRRLVIVHDERLERTTNGRGTVEATTHARLVRLDAGSWFHARFAGARILLVSQALALIPQRIGVILELKPTRRAAILRRGLLRIVARSRMARRLVVSSSEPSLLDGLRKSGLARALVCSCRPLASLRQARDLGCREWHPHEALLSKRLIQRAHAAGLSVHAWTVDTAARARGLGAWGVDGIFTNDPAGLRASLSSPLSPFQRAQPANRLNGPNWR